MEFSGLLGGACDNLISWFVDNERGVLNFLAVMMTALVSFILIDNKKPECNRYLPDMSANYKRHMIDNRLAAMLTYLPAFLIPIICICISKNATHVNIVLVMLMISHYLQRTFVYGTSIRGNSKISVHMFVTAFAFCTVNGYMIGRYHTEYAVYDKQWFTDPRFIMGVCMFFIGMCINVHSDHILRNLRKPGETGYKIPRGGMFEYVSGANYFGEIVEWAGFCVACWTLQSMSFLIFTTGYIGFIKAFNHHRWYLDKFEDYPKNRKAVIPS